MTQHEGEHEEATREEEENVLLREQEEKGYGTDTGERDEALEEELGESPPS